ncbi:MAG TPA: hypothetical protein VM487_00330, partial [Phycisphaerae bacterium]|nr:hypothetical protein [Phycisphaerae bacterium]
MSYQGDEFVAIDDDAFGDGDVDTRSVNTWLQNRLNGNFLYLAQGRSRFAFQPVCNHSSNPGPVGYIGERPWAAQRYISIGLWDFPATKGLAGLDLHLVYRVSDGFPSFAASVRVMVVLGTKKTFATLSDTTAAGYLATTISIDLDEPWSEAEALIPFQIFVKSSVTVENTSAGQEDLVRFGIYWTATTTGMSDPTWLDDSGLNNPDFDSLEIQVLKSIDTSGNPIAHSAYYDLLHVQHGGAL